MLEVDEETARRVLKEAEERRRAETTKHRDKDRRLTRPWHFHATVWCYVDKDGNGNFVDAQHNEVMGMSPDSCVRRAINFSEERQSKHHLSQLTMCPDPTHSTRELED